MLRPLVILVTVAVMGSQPKFLIHLPHDHLCVSLTHLTKSQTSVQKSESLIHLMPPLRIKIYRYREIEDIP